MPKFVLRCKVDNNHFLADQRSNKMDEEISFTTNIDYALEIGQHIPDFKSAELHFATNYTQLAHSLFEVYEVSAPRCVINILNTNLFVMTVHDTISFTEDIKCALEKPERLMIQVFDKIKDKVKSKLQLVKL